LYGRDLAASQQALSGLVDRSQGYDQALLDARVPTRLGDGAVDVEVEGELMSPFAGVQIEALSIRANWLRQAEPGSSARVVGFDANGRALLSVGGASFTYGIEGVAPSARVAIRCAVFSELVPREFLERRGHVAQTLARRSRNSR
jgi:hypothetical protein